jgi:segregation and condensation protein B
VDDQQLKAALEALLFISGSPLTVDRFTGIFEDASKGQIEDQLRALKNDYKGRGAGIMLTEVAGGWQLATCADQAAWVRKFKTVKAPPRLSRPALETLAIVAYRQPITRPEIEAIRGVNIGGIVRNLMERRLVKIVGKKDVPGKPMLYGTTSEFLQYFGLKDLASLPTLKEFQDLDAGEDALLEQRVPAGEEDAAVPERETREEASPDDGDGSAIATEAPQ